MGFDLEETSSLKLLECAPQAILEGVVVEVDSVPHDRMSAPIEP